MLSVIFWCASNVPQSLAQPTSLSDAADSVMITVFLKHQQDKNLDSLQSIQAKNNFWQRFPIKESRVVSWYVMMGIGQVITLKLPADKLRALNLSVEKGAWGAFNTEFYPTYDFEPVWRETYKKLQTK